MKHLFYLSLLIGLFSCKQKEASKSDYMQRALKSDAYKIKLADYNRVLDSLKNGSKDTNAVIFIYNTIFDLSKVQAKNMLDVKNGIKRDSGYLKSEQMKIAAQLEQDHQDSISKAKQ
ncbi:MAG TPA: hypothetical protein VGN20_22655 [Mucilaginibacter sp.]|jgi:hypothetical protein